MIYGSSFDFTFYFVYLALMLHITRPCYLSLFRDHIRGLIFTNTILLFVLFFYLKYLSSLVGALRKLVWKRWGFEQGALSCCVRALSTGQ